MATDNTSTPAPKTRAKRPAPSSTSSSSSTSLTTSTTNTTLTLTTLHLALLYAQFTSLVQDPIRAQAWGLAPLAVLQGVWVVLCVVPSRGRMPVYVSRPTTPTGKAGRSRDSRTGHDGGSENPEHRNERTDSPGPESIAITAPIGTLLTTYVLPILSTFFTTTLRPLLPAPSMLTAISKRISASTPLTLVFCLLVSILPGTLVVAVVLVLFGAPLTTHRPHTLLCAAHMALMAGPGMALKCGLDAGRWRREVALLAEVDEVVGALVGTAVGAWVGAVPIPLDWDREWQKWPVTIVTGAYAGFLVGRLAGGTLFRGKTVDFD